MGIDWQRPLTDAQLGIWLGQQIDPQSSRYNAAEYIELRGPLDTVRFEQALREIIDQSVALHLVFKQTETGPQQLFQEKKWRLEKKDFSTENISHEIRFKKAKQWMREDLSNPANLECEPLFAQALLKLDEDYFIWYQRIHHISCDGFAFSLLTEQVAQRYSILTGANAASIIEQPQHEQYKHQLERFDAIRVEELNYRESPAFEKDRTFWLAQSAVGENKSRHEPFSFSASTAAMADTAARVSGSIGAEEFTRLQSLAASKNISWSDLLLAAVAQTLYFRTGAAEITLGVPVMNRMGSASLRIPAMVMNIIPLRINMRGLDCFAEVASSVSQHLKAARPHLRYRYEYLKRDLGLSGTQKLFGPVVNIMPFDRPMDFSGLDAQVHNLSAGPVEDISFSFILKKSLTNQRATSPAKNYLQFDLDANPNRYTPEKLAELQQLFLQQFREILINFDSSLAVDTPALSWLEGENLAPPTHSILHNIYQQAQLRPNAIALENNGKVLDYQQLLAQSAALAHAIQHCDVSPGSIIALVLPRSEMAIISALACWLSGCTFVFLDPEAPQERNGLIISNSNPALIIYEKIHGDDPLLGNVNLNVTTTQYLQHKSPVLTNEQVQAFWITASGVSLADLKTPAYLIYTSGSTGTPKGVIIGHTALAEFVASNKQSYNIQSNDRVLQFAPLHFDACIEEIFVTLSEGACLVLRNQSMLESMPIFLAQCTDWKISVLDLPTAFWHELAFACQHLSLQVPPCLRAIIIGGEAVIGERVEQWRARFGETVALFNTYGPSEATVIASCINLCSRDCIEQKLPLSIGSPLSGRAAMVVDENLHILPKGEEGELLLCGSGLLEGGLASGYLHLPEKTTQAFIQMHLPWLAKSVRAYRTGDRVKINSHNQIEFIGRLDDQLKISGYRIDPLEIEAALIKLDSVREAAIVPVAGTHNEKILIAHIVLDHNKPALSIQQLRAELKEKLPAPMLPGAVIYHPMLPKNTSGKIDRKELQRQSSALNEHTSADDVQLSEQQKIIVAIWREVLGQKNIRLDDDFFALGGQSLQCIQVANRLSAKLQREIPVAWLFQHPSVGALDKLLNQSASSSQTKTNTVHEQMALDCENFAHELPVITKAFSMSAGFNQRILLTGATGFVGAQLLAELVTLRHKVICLVRAEDEATAYERIYHAVSNQALSLFRTMGALKESVHVQLGDLSRPRLGLTEELFSQLGNSIDVVIHNAANTSVMRDYQSLRHVNALSTAELLKLAALHQLPFHLISTVALAPFDTTNNRLSLPEDFVPQHSELRDGYQQSKWAAENMARIASEKGYAINVYRLARVTGDTHSAYVNNKDLVWNILQAGLPLGVLPHLDFAEPWTPVDTVTAFIARHCLANPAAGVFNLAPQKNIAIARLYDWLTQLGQSFAIVPLAEWCATVKRYGPAQHQPIAEFFVQNMQARNEEPNHHSALPSTPYIARAKFAHAAAQLTLELPDINQPLFNRYFAFAAARGWFTPAGKRQTVASEELSYE